MGGVAKAGVSLDKIGIEASSKVLGSLAAKGGIEASENIAKLELNTSTHLDLPEPINPPTKPPVTFNSGILR